jgi:DNA-binding SARP family transcriptional activator
MRINILGPLSISEGSRTYELAPTKTTSLLAVLALTPGTPISPRQLVEELWANNAVRNTRNALHATTTRLRRLLASVTGRRGDELIRTVHGGYLLDIAKHDLDAHHFLELTEQAEARLADDPAGAVVLLEQAIGYWRGPALLDIQDSLRCRLEAAYLDEFRLSAWENLMTARLAIGKDRSLIAELRQLTTQHPERERFGEQLMLALHHDGRQTEALDTFHSIRRRLAAETGLQPGRALSRLYESILASDGGITAQVIGR